MRRRHVAIMSLATVALLYAATVLPLQALGGDDPVEEVEEVEVVSQTPAVDTAAESGAAGFTVKQIIGRNHPAAVHLPIGLLVAVWLVEVISLLRRPALEMGKSGMVLSAVTALSFIPAALSGLLRASELFAGREPSSLLLEHRNIMIASFTVFLAALVLRLVKKDNLAGWMRYVHLALVTAALLLAGLGGHHGGQLVYGESYLPY